MDGHEFYKYSKPCIDNNIVIYPRCYGVNKFKIIINTNGREKVGEEIYEDKPFFKTVVLKTPQGLKTIKTEVPSVYDKILELYKTICERNKLLPIIN